MDVNHDKIRRERGVDGKQEIRNKDSSELEPVGLMYAVDVTDAADAEQQVVRVQIAHDEPL